MQEFKQTQMRKLLISMVANFLFWQNQTNFLFGYKVRTTIIVLGYNQGKIILYQQNWMLVFRLLYHKCVVKTGFTFALQFFMLISDSLRGVNSPIVTPRLNCLDLTMYFAEKVSLPVQTLDKPFLINKTLCSCTQKINIVIFLTFPACFYIPIIIPI